MAFVLFTNEILYVTNLIKYNKCQQLTAKRFGIKFTSVVCTVQFTIKTIYID